MPNTNAFLIALLPLGLMTYWISGVIESQPVKAIW